MSRQTNNLQVGRGVPKKKVLGVGRVLVGLSQVRLLWKIPSFEVLVIPSHQASLTKNNTEPWDSGPLLVQ